jgi:hypothetical protein
MPTERLIYIGLMAIVAMSITAVLRAV